MVGGASRPSLDLYALQSKTQSGCVTCLSLKRPNHGQAGPHIDPEDKPASQTERRRDYHRQKITPDPVYKQVCLESPQKLAQGAPELLEEISPRPP
jgi:hypothetical protein